MPASASLPLSVLVEGKMDLGQFVEFFLLLLYREKLDLCFDAPGHVPWHRLFKNLHQLARDIPGRPRMLGELQFHNGHSRELEIFLEAFCHSRIVTRSTPTSGYVLPEGTAALWRDRFDELGEDEKHFFSALVMPLARIEEFGQRHALR